MLTCKPAKSESECSVLSFVTVAISTYYFLVFSQLTCSNAKYYTLIITVLMCETPAILRLIESNLLKLQLSLSS